MSKKSNAARKRRYKRDEKLNSSTSRPVISIERKDEPIWLREQKSRFQS